MRVPIMFSYDNRLFLLSRVGTKVSARDDGAFSCSTCHSERDAQSPYTTIEAQAADGSDVRFKVCSDCRDKASALGDIGTFAPHGFLKLIELGNATPAPKPMSLSDLVGATVAVHLKDDFRNEQNELVVITGAVREASPAIAAIAKFEIVALDGTHQVLPNESMIDHIEVL